MKESYVQRCTSGQLYRSGGHGYMDLHAAQGGDTGGNSPIGLRLRKKYVLVTHTVKHGGCWTASIHIFIICSGEE